ncbi:hypothetical protein L1887_54150 [Cichorium endivia]|nr:hypothetical protein L1887_54150 [Cichorium endivia]
MQPGLACSLRPHSPSHRLDRRIHNSMSASMRAPSTRAMIVKLPASSCASTTLTRAVQQRAYSNSSKARGSRYATAAAAVTAAALTTWYSVSSPVHSEAAPSVAPLGGASPPLVSQQDQMRDRARLQGVYAWGSNRYNVVAPDAPSVTLIRSPRSIPFFDGVALRDINLQEKHGVAVDANGDVYQWGLGFFDPSVREVTSVEDVPLGRRREKAAANLKAPLANTASLVLNPVKTLTGKNIIKVEATEEKIYALSKDGHIYVFSAVQQQQAKPKYPGWSKNPFTLFNAFASSTIDHEVLHPAPSAHWGSTEKPRVFAELEANHGGRPIASLVPSDWLPAPPTQTNRTSKPQASSEPAFETSTDPAPPPKPLTEPVNSIRWCTTLHEVPALRKVNVVQIAAGNEHSLARTHDGRVLAWGRHTHGQCGLGTSFSMECVPVPTEVVLSRSFSNSSLDVRATSIAAGADNSFFMTTRREAGGKFKIDLLASGKGQWGTIGNAMWSQLGVGKRSNLAVPQHLKPLPGLTTVAGGNIISEQDGLAVSPEKIAALAAPKPTPAFDPKLREADLNSGALTHMPHNRLQLASKTKTDTHLPPAISHKDQLNPTATTAVQQGKTKKNVQIEESIKAGTVSTVVFWKIHE